MKRTLQKWVVAAALRAVHAALVELRTMDAGVADEFSRLPAGISYAIHTGHGCPSLYVQWDGAELRRLPSSEKVHCEMKLKALSLSFRLLTGQIGLAQGYAQHALTIAGDIADVMRLARLVNYAEAYLFPPFITKRFLAELPALSSGPLRLYGRLLLGFLRGKY